MKESGRGGRGVGNAQKYIKDQNKHIRESNLINRKSTLVPLELDIPQKIFFFIFIFTLIS